MPAIVIACMLPLFDQMDRCASLLSFYVAWLAVFAFLVWSPDSYFSAFSSMALTNALKAEVSRILDSDDGVNVKISKLTKIFLDSGLTRYEVVHPNLMLCHPSNRGGSMLNGHDVLQKGELLMKQGIRLDLLEASSVAFCLSRQEKKRLAQVNANWVLANQHPELLAHPSGVERYLSVGTSHSTAYCRAMLAGVIAESPAAKQEGPAKTCLQTGWKWLILDDALEDEFPSLPLVLAAGLNSTNQVHVNQSEIEVLLTIGRYVSLHGMSVEAAKEKCKESEPACKDYIDCLAHFAAQYGGGLSFPLLEFLGAFGKVYGASLVLGSEFVRAVSYSDFRVDGNLLPCIRVALLAAQVASPKAVDKVAKLLSKADVDKLRGMKDKSMLMEAETLLQGCWKTVEAASLDSLGQQTEDSGLRTMLGEGRLAAVPERESGTRGQRMGRLE